MLLILTWLWFALAVSMDWIVATPAEYTEFEWRVLCEFAWINFMVMMIGSILQYEIRALREIQE